MKLNKVLTTKDFDELSIPGGYIDYVKSNYTDLPMDDALIKHGSIIQAVDHLGLSSEMTILDAGCGSPKHPGSPLTIAKKTNSRLLCIDRQIIGRQFSLYEKSSCFKGDFFDISKRFIPDSTVDLIIDGCSITHFKTTSELAGNDGCYEFGFEAMRILKPGGYFICASDTVNSYDDNIKGEFVTFRSMLDAFKASGLEVCGDSEEDLEDAFIGNPPNFYTVSRIVLRKPADGGEK